ncbi:transporter substrate-binding domain-containing protein [Pseudodesulfovibrio sp.]|uniref:PAS domain S-box protein n=1 Tax=Pseudodesulfovibrio sp. TaxID=2035812 RepID=UPI00260767BF|nr:transporter substrate-binding domain-containing protein [Pseudodesulfovibrio sp.]MDD3313460.1 PAS domain S-box protein [Pseudodesulfovibrio sp.]
MWPTFSQRFLLILALATCLAAGPAASADDALLQVNTRPISMSPEERNWLDAHKEIRLGLWLGPPPVMFRGDDGSLQGLAPTYVNLIVAKLGIEPRRVRASGLTAMNGLALAREVDMVAALPMDRANAEAMVLSEPYVFLPIVLVTRSDFRFVSGLADLAGSTVAVGRDCVPVARLAKDHPELKLLIVDDPAEAMRAVDSGRADAYVGAQASVAALAERLGIVNIRISAITEYSHSLAVGVRRDWPVLLALVNRALASISVDERKTIDDYWTVLHHGQWVSRPRVWRLVGGLVLGASALLGVILLWNLRLAREIRRRKRMEEAVRRAHAATRQIIESADVIIVGLDYEGRVRLFNRAGEAVTGYSRDELMGRDWFDLVVPRERFLFAWDEFCRLVRGGPGPTAETFETPVLTKDGEVRHILWRNSAIGPMNGGDETAILSFGTDITHRLKAEEELRLTQFAMDNASLGILRVRPSGRIVYANRTAATMLGRTRGEIRSQHLADLGPFPPMTPWQPFWDRLVQARVLNLESSLETLQGPAMPVSLRLHHLLFKGSELAICFLDDITERKRVEHLRADVERMMRHDLRSPTLAVQTMLLLLERRGGLNDRQLDLLSLARDAAKRMMGIIALSRTLYRMEEGVYEPERVPVDLLPVVSSVAEELGDLMRSRRIQLEVTVGGRPTRPRAAFLIRSDELPCYALLLNLLKNAAEASPEGGTVTLDLSTGERHVITVHNMGAIPAAIRDVFFEKYVTAGKPQGTGLGTYTARLIAGALGGDIAFTTSEEQGTTLTVTLPVWTAQSGETDS